MREDLRQCARRYNYLKWQINGPKAGRRGGEAHHSAAGPKQRRGPAVSSAQLQQPRTTQTTAGQYEPLLSAEAAAV